MTLEYLQRRITFDKKRPQQVGRELEGSAFYHAIDRPDLAEQWLSHNPWVWVPGLLTTIGGVALFAGGIGYGTTVEGQEGWFIGGSLGGTFMTAGGIVMIVLGFTGDKNPMNIGERKAAAAGWNKKQREARGLGPEADWNNPQSRRQLKLRPVVSLQLKTAGIGLSGTW